MTLLDLFLKNGISPNSKSNNCRTYQIRYAPKDDKRYLFLVKCKEDYSDPKGHIISINFLDKGKKVNRRNITPLQSNVKVYCHCPAFIYWGSAYNATKGKYKLQYKPREFREPNIRDPKRENLICKHLANATVSFKYKNFNMIGKGRMSIVSSLDELPNVSINECMGAIKDYLLKGNEWRIPQDLTFNEFMASLNEDNFENQLLSIGMIK